MAAILVVDDDTIMQRMLVHVLEKQGHAVAVAGHGQIALEHLSKTRFDLLITDLTMPVMDGITLLQHIRSNESTQALKVIMLTASGQDSDRIVARQAGVDDFLTKPASSREINATVHRVLEGSQGSMRQTGVVDPDQTR
jgi:DNA-binding response OmpR family regulator